MLTPAQLALLKADILANTNQAVIAGLNNGDSGGIAAWYNLDAAPEFWAFRYNVTAKEVSDAIHLDEVANITSADSDRAVKLFQIRSFDGGQFHGNSASDRAAWDDVFSAAAGDASQQAIAALWQRPATNAEKVFALGTNTGVSAATADTTSFQGSVNVQDISSALAST